MPSHAVGSLPSMVRPFDSRCGLLRIPLRSRSSEPGADVLRSPLCAFLSRPSGLCPQRRGDSRTLMFPKPKPSLTPKTYAHQSEPLAKPTGFRAPHARSLLGKELTLMGVQALGMAL